MEELYGVAFEITDVDIGANTIEAVGHNVANGDKVRVISVGGTIPAGLDPFYPYRYFAKNVSGDELELSLTFGGATIDLTGVGSGTLYLIKLGDPASVMGSATDYGNLRDELDNKGALVESNTWTLSNFFHGMTILESTLGTLAPAGGNINVTPAGDIYSVDPTGGGTVTFQAPPAAWPDHPIIRVYSTGAGGSVAVRTHVGPANISTLNGAAAGWVDIRYTGSTWTTVGWGGDATRIA